MANGNGNGKKKRRKLLYIVISCIVILCAAGVLIASRSGDKKIDPNKLGKVERGDLARSVVATGKVEPITKVEIKSKASGIVKKLYVEYGDHVKAGQMLAELDREEMLAQVRQSEAQLSSSEATLVAAIADLKRSEVDAEGPDVPLLRRAYDRAIKMAGDGVVSQSALEDAQKGWELAVNKQNVARAQVLVNKGKVEQARADVSRARATLAQLKEQLSYTSIAAPIDGIVLSRDVEVGDAVSSILVLGSSATLVMTIGDTREVYVKGKVDESDIGKVYLGQPARIRVESFKDKTFTGKVTKISPMGVEKDNVTTFEVRVSINNPGGELKAMMTANAEIILEEHKNVLIVPEASIIYDRDKKASIEVPDPKGKEGKRKVPVQVGISNGAKTELLGGLNEGAQVVLQ
ncbi:MAG TPA: efflux RND transporter periplasmic adaptor subunit [candidate division Zixibacteria bacterium]|nr:efflux RND transporter periplasmic adaptor subunit [candidate division Zixibacteria bacterium]